MDKNNMTWIKWAVKPRDNYMDKNKLMNNMGSQTWDNNIDKNNLMKNKGSQT